MIAELVDCDVYRLEAADPYPTGYDATVDRNSREQRDDARPGIADPLASIEQYDILLIGSPIWNVRTPMIMSTFCDSHDFTGKTVHPFVTYAVSGLGPAQQDYTPPPAPAGRSKQASQSKVKRYPTTAATSRPGSVPPACSPEPPQPSARPPSALTAGPRPLADSNATHQLCPQPV